MKYEVPVKTEYMREQMNHEPTRSYAEEIYSVIKMNPYISALEIGAAWGVSALAILDAQDKGTLLSVDKDETAFAPREVGAVGFNDRWAFSCESSDHFWKRNTTMFDFIYIDGSHLYDDVKNDMFKAWSFLIEGGTLMIDDMTHKANKDGEYGVSLAAWEFVVNFKPINIQTTTRLAYFKK